jgi:predicted HicB family RNase H-like nuclease
MKSKKKQRAYRCTDTLHALVEGAASAADMSVNEWTLYAIRSQLERGIAGGEPFDLDKVGELAKANSVDKLTAAIERSQKVFGELRKELGLPESE